MSTYGRSMLPVSPGNICVEIPTSRASAQIWSAPPAVVPSALQHWRPSPSAGECDFANTSDTAGSSAVIWTPLALPSVITLTALPPGLVDPDFGLAPAVLGTLLSAVDNDGLIERPGAILRVQTDPAGILPPAILLPLDRLFEIRVAAALHLFRALTGRNHAPNPASLSPARRGRLILALRGLDGRLAGASHREIACALFGADAIARRDWISHELRDRTARLVRLGFTMMRGGYRRLLLHPYRRRK
jgi:hypothetical protein